MEYDISATQLVAIDTDEDPDGSDRGGFHQVTHTLTVDGDMLTVELEVTDYYEERMGELPAPVADTKEDAIDNLEGLISSFERKLTDLRTLLENVRATTEFKLITPDEDEDDSDEEEDD